MSMSMPMPMSMSMCVRQLDLEEQKRARWKAENVRRKHNYVPFIINLLR